jgi:nucleoside-diphosphate kinase
VEKERIERTLAIIKPDGVERNLIGEIIRRLENNRLRVVGLKMLKLQKSEAEQFYAVHRQRPFFPSLTTYMASGVVVAMVLEGENAIKRLRDLMGATDSKQAAPGTIRADFGMSIEQNTVHGSDSAESAVFEIPFFFNRLEIVERLR